MAESKELRAIQESLAELEASLREVEQRVFDAETEYIEETPMGNVVRGFEGFDSKSRPNMQKRSRASLKERIFSGSSVTAPMEEQPMGFMAMGDFNDAEGFGSYTSGGGGGAGGGGGGGSAAPLQSRNPSLAMDDGGYSKSKRTSRNRRARADDDYAYDDEGEM